MGVDVVCHSLLYSVKEGRSFHLGCSLFLFAASRHPWHMQLQGFCSQGCKDILEVVLTVRHDGVEEEPVLQGTSKDGERVVCIFWVPVIDGQADECSSSCQCTSNGVGCGLYRLCDQLLWGQFWGHVSDPGWSDNGQIRKWQGGIKNGYNWGTISLICLIFEQCLPEGICYTVVSRSQWHHNRCQQWDGITKMGK